jgi:hypothetical protein
MVLVEHAACMGLLNLCNIWKMTGFWVVAPCSLVKVYRRFRGPVIRMKSPVSLRLFSQSAFFCHHRTFYAVSFAAFLQDNHEIREVLFLVP